MQSPPAPADSARRLRYALRLCIIGVAYLACARLGVSMAYHGQDASLVWPAHGVGLAAMLLFGRSVWPALAAAALTSALMSGAPLLSASIVVTGNVVGTMAGASLLSRRSGFRPSLDRVKDVLALIGAGGAVSALISATVGVSCLYLRGVYPPGTFGTHWLVWWTGDMTGAITAAPLILVWARRPPWLAQRPRQIEFAALLLLTLAASALAFDAVSSASFRYPLVYLVFPFTLWAAYRFEQHGAVAVTLLVGSFAVLQTLQGAGPFSRPSVQQTLMYLQAFVVVVSISALIVACLISERSRLERAQREMLKRERAARLEAQKAAAARDKVLAVVSHEVRNPLATVLLNSTALQEIIAPEGQEGWVRRALKSIEISAEQINHVLNDLTDVTLLEEGRISLETAPCAPASLVDDAVRMLCSLARDRGLQLEGAVGWNLPPVAASRERLMQVFSNLVGNAIRFTPTGGRIVVGAERDGAAVRFSVSDTGPGIDCERIPELLLPYWQAPLESSMHGGLGIPIARAIVDSHGGTFWIESEAGAGARILFTLPILDGACQDVGPSGSVERDPGGRAARG